MSCDLYVQYGCGWAASDHWLNFDASPTLRVERISIVGRALSAVFKDNPKPFPGNVKYGDIIKGLPLKDGSCAGVYCSHILEHLSLEDCRKALANTRRLLRQGGVFRLVIPDLAFYTSRYLSAEGPDAALEFMRDTGLGESVRNRGPMGFARESLGNSKHRWMWDYPSMERELLEIGFQRVRRAEYCDGDDPMFTYVEMPERWENCLGIQCLR